MSFFKLIQLILMVSAILGSGVSQSEMKQEKITVEENQEQQNSIMADYDGDGEQEAFHYSATGGAEAGSIEIEYFDANSELPFCEVDSVSLWDGKMQWVFEEAGVEEYLGQPVAKLRFWCLGSNGWGYYREISYGLSEGRPAKIKEEEGWGDYLGTTFLYDGSVKKVEDRLYIQFMEENSLKEGYECDIDKDGITELFVCDNESIYDKTRDGIFSRFAWETPETNVYYAGCVLQEDGSLLAYYETGEWFTSWVREAYTFDADWNVKKDVYTELEFRAEELETAGQEELNYLKDNFFPDTDLEALESGIYCFENGQLTEVRLYEK